MEDSRRRYSILSLVIARLKIQTLCLRSSGRTDDLVLILFLRQQICSGVFSSVGDSAIVVVCSRASS
ncbi:hypothetical protein AALP_AA5G144500 [Arabis alpina]|uniref:Uncharacterized protein n=1 Tax=Arabis alpina TaxID=50452 RepID=A0A087GX32_ARAAL|nr:hypothetical protein AALP_AA5G144500 [Arabis alpina]